MLHVVIAFDIDVSKALLVAVFFSLLSNGVYASTGGTGIYLWGLKQCFLHGIFIRRLYFEVWVCLLNTQGPCYL